MSNLHVIDHPLITHKLSIIRNRKTRSKDIRELLMRSSAICRWRKSPSRHPLPR